MRKLMLVFILFGFFSFAEEDISMHYFKKNSLEKKEEIKIEDTCSKHVIDTTCCFNTGLFLTGQYLLWRAHNYSMPMAMRMQDLTVSQQNVYTVVDRRWYYETIDAKWDSGFRVNAGYNTPFDEWVLLASWTHYNTKHRRTITDPDNNLFGIQHFIDELQSFYLVNINSVKGIWQFNYNTYDFDLGKIYYVLKKLSLKPFMGLRGASLYQNKYIYYDNIQNNNYTTAQKTAIKNNYWGIGPRTGFTTDWHPSKYLTFFGDISFSLLFGEVNYQNSLTWIHADLTQIWPVTKTNYNKYYEMKPTAGILLGFSTGGCMHNDKIYFGLDLAFEYNYYWDQNFDKNFDKINIVAANSDGILITNPGSVDLLGLTLGFRLEF